ncbi:transcription antitermination factor NusB [Flaviaesturariibacter flavus]|uniref:Transcription antitermination protein NusB n=1 Tax=Flaviaesturariibacter flavus TaxID=2502780 RepID=A0A4R1BA39_9BACT|nr:transcription antitermination factor NusB [Flaviaesturariibacter flavus]TCJ13800.1 transcription antitermination factor NusB [Flaviaesturariibacter flavus]
MISRRNIRVKVMQTLYTWTTQADGAKDADAQRLLQKHFDRSRDLLQYMLYFLSEVASYAELDSYQRRSKHLPSAEDLNVNIKIAGNELLWTIKEDPSLAAEWNQSNAASRIDRDLVRSLYQKMAASTQYHEYIASESRERKSERAILEFILEELMLPDDNFISHIEELFANWDDDGEMVVQIIQGFLQKPAAVHIDQFISGEKLQFAKSLLSTVLEKREHLESYIHPKLKNWDAERIAALDMILMKMGVAELLYFETIPPKVTINEYIELAKEYSTPQSGQFINGILDGIHKDLVTAGELHKTDFRKSR